MKDLIEALTIFHKYYLMRGADVYAPTHCEHDVFMVAHVGKDIVSKEDRAKLESLSFYWNDEYDCWVSYRFGSS